MEVRQKNQVFSRRHFIWRVLTVLMFFYVCADVSVLEYFCGNVSLGIASYRQIVKTDSPPAKTFERTSARKTIDFSPFSKNDRETEIPFDGDDCFCCSSHAIGSCSYLVVSFVPVSRQQREPVFFQRQSHSDWHLPPFYRPPQIS